MTEKELNSIYPNPPDFRSAGNFKPPKKRGSKKIIINLLIFVLVISSAFFAWVNREALIDYYGTAKEKLLEIRPTPAPVNTSDWQTFSNTSYGYQVKYPKNWVYYQWKSIGVYSSAYKETIGFDLGPKGTEEIAGDIRVSAYTQDLEKTVSDIKDQASFTSGPNQLKEMTNVNIGGIQYRKLTFTKFIPEPKNYNQNDRQIIYITQNGQFSYAITLLPLRKYQAIDEQILASFQFRF